MLKKLDEDMLNLLHAQICINMHRRLCFGPSEYVRKKKSLTLNTMIN